jgi:hypothetical protein
MTSAIFTVIFLRIFFIDCLWQLSRKSLTIYCYEESSEGYCLLPKNHTCQHRWISDIDYLG